MATRPTHPSVTFRGNYSRETREFLAGFAEREAGRERYKATGRWKKWPPASAR